MERHYFAEAEDRAFTALVLEYNALAEESTRHIELEEKIRERTSILLYLIPMRNLYLGAEDAGGFFLDIQKDIGRIISSFRVSGLTYNGYLTQICRYRVMRYTRRKMKEKTMDEDLIVSDITIHEAQLSEKCLPYSAQHPQLSEMSLGEISRHIVRTQGQKTLSLTDAERKLTELLRKPVKRRQFISYLLALPETETPGFIAGISRLLRIDMETASRFYTLRHEYLHEGNGETIENLEMVAGRHWKVMTRLRRAIWMETDMEKRDILLEKYRKLSEVYLRRRREIARAHCGLTHRAIAEVLGVSRSAVTYDIKAMRTALERISEGL